MPGTELLLSSNNCNQPSGRMTDSISTDGHRWRPDSLPWKPESLIIWGLKEKRVRVS
jgi:hypothetical protein